ncbi:MAG: 3-dehydroquinate synthase [Sulfolobales archaeon]|jgi:3-dehydroquinate synthase|nr:3-dehydroquinate synthase [Sulfolobales archaeon]MDT7899864.1 3-dehydroquinate synthase [Sulfolobales archaeon]MDT7906094.1 3-dehydroquinate synthase [Sulfolobales archaeon]PVU73076.1 3-dehydroquinate synthase [Sulfolobales archaeon SCGC AB-777_J03]
MREITQTVCCNDVRFVVGRNALEVLRELTGKIAVFHPLWLDPTPIRKVLPEAEYFPVEDGERLKDVNNVLVLAKELFERGYDRGDTIIAVGGGSVTDTVGFLASIYLRGIRLVNVPTTLLGMVDAAIGGKTGVNFAGIKNVLGTFYQPSLIIAELSFLDTLPQQELRNGLSEVIKYSIVLDSALYNILMGSRDEIMRKDDEALEEVIIRSASNKLDVVAQDERETKGIRIVLNFGHTVGHAIESATDFKVHHGLAISVGMTCESKFAEELGYAEEGLVEDTLSLLTLYELPVNPDQLDPRPDPYKALKALEKDKKRRSDVLLVPVPRRIGAWTKAEIPVETFKGLTEQCLR